MNINEFRKKTEQELKELLKTKANELAEVRKGLIKGNDKDTSKVKKTRKEIAQLSTILKEKEVLSLMEESNA